ncbi:OmpA family protein [Sphingomonas sp. MMS12-HWE2-04]|uniref:OmpA family protein n=1 Tax=Sphingomonas sp. MMS12-HWE2-04 TaxID=3234199 RepID=UPI00384F3DB7
MASLVLAACTSQPDAATNAITNGDAAENAAKVANLPEPGNAVAAAVTAAGFDPASMPIGDAPTGAWPYFSMMDGYEPLSLKNGAGDSSRELQRDVAYDRYEFFDGKKLIPIEGRLYTMRAIGKGASIFQAEKTYEKLVHDLGGVTVWEGSGKEIVDAKLKFSENRHRGLYNFESEKGGVYMVRTPGGGAIWVEVWKRWQDEDDSYWLTIVEKKPLEMKAKMLDAEAMKAALDAQGHIALYINFDTDKTAIKPNSQPTLAEIVKLLNANPALKLEVQGHTDNSGTAAHNQQLSTGRASAVLGALISQGIAIDRLTAKGYGQTKPVADNASEDGKAQNRRVELVKR